MNKRYRRNLTLTRHSIFRLRRLTSRPRQTLKSGNAFAVVDSHGDIGVVAGEVDGIFHCDTRHLSRLEVLIDGAQPLLLGSNMRDDNTLLTVDLTNADQYLENELILQKDTLHIVRTFFLWQGVAYLRLGIQNHGDVKVCCTVSIVFANDFADIFEVRGTRRAERGKLRSPVIDLQSIVLGSVENQDSPWKLGVIQAFDGKIRFDGRPMGEDGTSLFGQTQRSWS